MEDASCHILTLSNLRSALFGLTSFDYFTYGLLLWQSRLTQPGVNAQGRPTYFVVFPDRPASTSSVAYQIKTIHSPLGHFYYRIAVDTILQHSTVTSSLPSLRTF
jgi:hypothetical protein